MRTFKRLPVNDDLQLFLMLEPIPVASRSKAWVYGQSLAGNAGSNPVEGRGCLSVASGVCCQVEVSVSG